MMRHNISTKSRMTPVTTRAPKRKALEQSRSAPSRNWAALTGSKAIIKNNCTLRGEGAIQKGQAIITKDLATFYAEEYDYRTAYVFFITSPSDAFDHSFYRATTTLIKLAGTVGATVAATRPGTGG